jgi:hypothetical protein
VSRSHVAIRVEHAALFAAFTALALYAAGLANGFAYDDVVIIAGDPRIHSLTGIGELLTSGYWRDESLALYRPLTSLSFALDWSIAPDTAAWFHLVNGTLHALATALVTILLARFFAPFAALAGGLLFAVHPVHVEAVANVVGRAELLAACGFLAAVLVWTHGTAEDRPPALRRIGAPVLFAFAVFSKESAITLPAVLLLIDGARGELRTGDRSSYARRNAVPFAILAIVALGYLAARAAVVGGVGGPDRLDPSLEVLGGTGERVLTALQAWPVYAQLLFVPVTLLADYGPRVLGPATTLDAGVAFGGLLLATTVLGGLFALRASRGTAAVAWLWFPITILPVSNLLFPIGVLVAERTLYLPSVAICFLAAAVAATLAGRAQRPRSLALAVGAVVLAVFAVRSAVRIPEWDSTDRIMAALARDRPDAFRGQWHRARIARAQGRDGEALALYGSAMELWPYRLGLVLETISQATRAGDLAYADRLSSFAVERWPSNVDARRLLAAVRLDMGDTTAARLAVGEGLRVAPDDETLRRMAHAIGVRSHLDRAR